MTHSRRAYRASVREVSQFEYKCELQDFNNAPFGGGLMSRFDQIAAARPEQLLSSRHCCPRQRGRGGPLKHSESEGDMFKGFPMNDLPTSTATSGPNLQAWKHGGVFFVRSWVLLLPDICNVLRSRCRWKGHCCANLVTSVHVWMLMRSRTVFLMYATHKSKLTAALHRSTQRDIPRRMSAMPSMESERLSMLIPTLPPEWRLGSQIR